MGNIARIRKLADTQGVSVSFLSQSIGKSDGYLSNISSRDADVPLKYLPILAELLKTSVEYLSGRTDDPTPPSESIIPTNEYGIFQYERFYDLCKQTGKKQAHLYELVGLPSKAGSNLRRTKKVKPEILEVWAKELNTSVAYLNGETDDPSPAPFATAPEQKEKAPQSAAERLTEGLDEESLKKLLEYAEFLKSRQEKKENQ